MNFPKYTYLYTLIWFNLVSFPRCLWSAVVVQPVGSWALTPLSGPGWSLWERSEVGSGLIDARQRGRDERRVNYQTEMKLFLVGFTGQLLRP